MMNSSDQNDLLCEKATTIFGNQKFRNMLITESITASLAIIPNILCLSVIRQITILPSNLRLLLGHLSLIFLLFAIGDLIKCVYLITESPCKFVITTQQCRLFDLATTWLVVPNIFYALMPICLERLYATVNYRFYDVISTLHKPWLAYFLIFCAWTTAILINGTSIFYLPNDQYVPICDGSFTPSPSKPAPTFGSYLALETVAIVATVFVHVYNRHVAWHMSINRAKYNLSSRFLIDQNVKINNLIVPSMILHVFFHIPAFSVVVLFQTVTFDIETGAILSRSTYLWRMVYALVHPLSAIYFNQYLRNRLADGKMGRFLGRLGIKLQKANKVQPSHMMSNAPAHFCHLNEVWAGKNVK